MRPRHDHVAIAEDPQLDVLAVDLGAVGALQIGDHDLVLIGLDFDVESADPLVVELDRVAFLAADGDGRRQFFEDAAAIGPVQDAQSNLGHKRQRATPHA